MQAIGWTGEPRLMRDVVMKALQAEGTMVGLWQNFILLQMTVFQARNAHGKGCPWSCNGVGDEAVYDRDAYPQALRHCETHFGMTVPLRAPNGPEIAERVADAFQKVFENIGQIDPEQILKPTSS